MKEIAFKELIDGLKCLSCELVNYTSYRDFSIKYHKNSKNKTYLVFKCYWCEEKLKIIIEE